MKITIREYRNHEREELSLLLDGTPAGDVEVYGGRGDVHVSIWSDEVAAVVLASTRAELPRQVTRWSFHVDQPEWPLDEITLFPSNGLLSFYFRTDLSRWDRGWSFAEYAEAVREAVATLEHEGVTWKQDDELIANGFRIFCAGNVPSGPVEEPIVRYEAVVRAIHDSAVGALQAGGDQNAAVYEFEFPASLRTACEQYLMYFAQFLSDVGVSATTDLRHVAGTVLFSVTPDDPDVALANVHEALGIYLKMAASPIHVPTDEIAMQRLAANVYHYRGQLALARATIEAQREVIIEKQATITALTSGAVLSDSLRGPDREEILGGTVALTTYEGKGFEINVAEIFRRLRAKFTKRNAG